MEQVEFIFMYRGEFLFINQKEKSSIENHVAGADKETAIGKK